MNPRSAIRNFAIDGRLQEIEPYGSGHIHDTFLAAFVNGDGGSRYILQRMNCGIFTEPEPLMQNIQRVTEHLRSEPPVAPDTADSARTLTIVPTNDDELRHRDENGDNWRVYEFIENAATHEKCSCPEQAVEAGRTVGRFQRYLSNLPPSDLHETIPKFHHTPTRFATLTGAIDRDPENRAALCAAEIAFAAEREAQTHVVTDMLDSGALPYRTTHNDTKLNNVMLDATTGRGLCLIDLDTVMRGSSLYDFGDMARTMAVAGREDETSLDDVGLDIGLFDAIARGYLEACRDCLTDTEIEHLPFSGRLITYTIGIRFLTDYLLGDTYFKTARPHHNLDRARAQFKAVGDMERLEDEMAQCVARYAG